MGVVATVLIVISYDAHSKDIQTFSASVRELQSTLITDKIMELMGVPVSCNNNQAGLSVLREGEAIAK